MCVRLRDVVRPNGANPGLSPSSSVLPPSPLQLFPSCRSSAPLPCRVPPPNRFCPRLTSSRALLLCTHHPSSPPPPPLLPPQAIFCIHVTPPPPLSLSQPLAAPPLFVLICLSSPHMTSPTYMSPPPRVMSAPQMSVFILHDISHPLYLPPAASPPKNSPGLFGF